jgi:putative transposase
VALHRAGQAVENAFIESFNSKLRDECLNEYVFTSLGEARDHRGVAALLQPPAAALKSRLPAPEEFAARNNGTRPSVVS